MKKTSGLMMTNRNKIIPNERRRQTWRKHRLNLIDRRSKWFYQQQSEAQSCDDKSAENQNAEDKRADETGADTRNDK